MATPEQRLKALEAGRIPPEPLDPNICRRPKCGLKVWCRGLCQMDYRFARQAIKEGAITWEELEREGKASPIERIKKARARRRYFRR